MKNITDIQLGTNLASLGTDCISRQAAIDEWKNDFKGYVNALNIPRDDYNGIMEYIDEVPPAQPDIVRCKECKHYTFEPGPNSINCYVQHCTRSVRVSTGPDEFCSRAERRTDGF